MSDYGTPPGWTREEWHAALTYDPDDEPTVELRSTLLGVPEGEQGVRLPLPVVPTEAADIPPTG